MEKRENFSRKRTAILSALQGSVSHPTAEQIYDQLKPGYPDLSLGTVYRNLKRFCQSGAAVSVGVIGGQEHFDGDLSPHAHVVCSRCGAVLDIHEDFFGQEALEEISRRTGYPLESASVVFRGVCGNCLEKDGGADR